jgi:hypothetical protein
MPTYIWWSRLMLLVGALFGLTAAAQAQLVPRDHDKHLDCGRCDPERAAELSAVLNAFGKEKRVSLLLSSDTDYHTCAPQANTDVCDIQVPVKTFPNQENPDRTYCQAVLPYCGLCVPKSVKTIRWTLKPDDNGTYVFGRKQLPSLGIWINRPSSWWKDHFVNASRQSDTVYSWDRKDSTFGAVSRPYLEHGHDAFVMQKLDNGDYRQCRVVDPPILNTHN